MPQKFFQYNVGKNFLIRKSNIKQFGAGKNFLSWKIKNKKFVGKFSQKI